MKKYEKCMIQDVKLTYVECDRCNKECTTTYVDILIKMSFCETSDPVETLCHACYENYFKKNHKESL